MSQPFIFVSCGQYTDAEKSLGRNIVSLVKSVSGLDAFFADDVQDLSGLESNILNALHDCAGFIAVMHPRGTIVRPSGPAHVRASVWIEQEVAIATYIRIVEKRKLPVIAFIHESVGREGIRDVIHLNPILFREESDILVALPGLLKEWKDLPATGISIQLRAGSRSQQQEHSIGSVAVTLVNDSSRRISELDGWIQVPAGILKHWSANYLGEDKSIDNPHYRRFNFEETNRGPIQPHSERRLFAIEYCTKCGVDDAGGVAALVAQATIEARLWIDGREYRAQKTIQELAEDAEARGPGHPQ